MSDPVKHDRFTRERIARWFARGLGDALEDRPHAVEPSDPDCQGDTGPRPYTDAAYEAGQALARKILADGERPLNVNPPEPAKVTRTVLFPELVSTIYHQTVFDLYSNAKVSWPIGVVSTTPDQPPPDWYSNAESDD